MHGEWQQERDGRSGAVVWRGDGVHRKVGDPAGIAAEAARLRWLGDHGVPCQRIVRHDAGELVTTTVPGRTGASPWPPSMWPVLTESLVALVHALHAAPVASCPFDRTLATTIPLAEAAEPDLDDLDGERRGWSRERLLDELRRTRPASEDLVVCHGDLTPSNVLFDDAGQVTGVIDVGSLGIADRHVDLAILTRDVADTWAPAHADRLLREFAADPSMIEFYRLLDEFC